MNLWHFCVYGLMRVAAWLLDQPSACLCAVATTELAPRAASQVGACVASSVVARQHCASRDGRAIEAKVDPYVAGQVGATD